MIAFFNNIAFMVIELVSIAVAFGPVVIYINSLEKTDRARDNILIKQGLPIGKSTGTEKLKRWAIGLTIFFFFGMIAAAMRNMVS